MTYISIPMYVTLKIGKNNKTPSSKFIKNQWRISGHFFSTESFVWICQLQAQRPRPNTSLLSPLWDSCTTFTYTHNQPAKKTQNIITMVPPIHRLPAAPILLVSAIAVRCVIDHNHCNPAMWLLLKKLTNSLFYWLIFYLQQLSFEVIACAFIRGHCIKTTRTDPSFSPISFLPQPPKSSLCFGMILD